MNVIFYTFSKRRNSTAQPSGGTQFSVELKEGCGVLRPSITLKYAGTVTNPAGWNYAYISDFNRYYWVDDWYYINRQWTATLRCDVLASYKAQIGASSQYITRSAAAFNGDIIDQLYPTKTAPSIESSSKAFWSTPASAADQVFVVCTAGRGGFMDYYLLNGEHLAELGSKVFDVNFYDSFDLGVLTPEVIKAITDPEESVCAITYIPVKWSNVSSLGSGVTTFYLGYYEFIMTGSADQMRHITPSASITLTQSLDLLAHPDAAQRGNYLNGDAYTQRTLYVPTVGTINLDNNLLAGKTKIEVSMTLNLASGMCTCIIYGTTGAGDTARVRLFVSESKVGVEYGFAARSLDIIDGGTQAVTSSIMAAASGDYVGAAAGIIGALQMSKPRLDILGKSGSIASFAIGILLEQVFYRPVADDNADRGRPLCEVRQISTLSGYNVCADATLALPATAEELAEVLSYLNGGFFYE